MTTDEFGEAMKPSTPAHRLAIAAGWAADNLMPDDGPVSSDFLLEAHDRDAAARFVRAAGDIGGEPLFRWMASKGMHALPAEGFAIADPAVRLWFEAFVATARALWPIVDPRPAAGGFVPPVLGADRAERVEADGPKNVPMTTAGVAVTRHYAPEGVAAPPGGQQGAVIGAEALADFAAGKIPTMDELLAMSPEERRGYAHLFGKGSDVEALERQMSDPAARLGDAPAADAESLHETVVERGGVAGAVAVGKVKGKAR